MIRYKKAEFNLQAMIISIAFIGLFISWVTAAIVNNEGSYDTTGYDPSTLSNYDVSDNLSADIALIQAETDAVVVDKGVFDYFAGIFNAVFSPFKNVYNSFKMLRNMGSSAVGSLQLDASVLDFIVVLLTTLVIIGLVIIKFFLGRDKNR